MPAMNSRSRRPALHFCALILVYLATIGLPVHVHAHSDADADKAAITMRLHQWAEAFNARDSAGACDLFAPDLISTVQGTPEAGRDAVCARLAAALAKPGVQLRYSPDIQEIIISGDLAVVRLIWTLTVRSGAGVQISRETGMDIFRRQADGKWSIIRFLAFPAGVDQHEAGSTSAGKPLSQP